MSDFNEELPAIAIAQLIARSISDDLSDDEKSRLEHWRNQSTENENLYQQLTNEAEQINGLQQYQRLDGKAALNRVYARHEAVVVSMHPQRKYPLIRILAIAASIIIVAGLAMLLFQHKAPTTKQAAVQNDVQPGGNNAVLTLANGQRIILNTASNGQLARQSGVTITKNKQGLLTYHVSNAPNGPIAYNTITTPAGGQYEVVLPDGSKVWLNAASSLRYPTHFSGPERVVVLTGEGYFDIHHNKAQPFKVQTANQIVTDIGTRFNINAYSNEATTVTTLVQGAVAVNSSSNTIKLKPGHQSKNQAGSLAVNTADIDAATAWKEGQFIFHNTDLKAIMRQLERWYNVQVDMSNLPDEQFNGAMSRDVKLSQVLDMLQMTSNLKFTIQGRRIILEK